MSSLVLAGNTSGTVTFQAPDVAGTTVLTLPTTSGTIFTANTSGGPLSIASGGTNATTAADARTSLGVPAANGTGASGTWAINITGNAATATNGGVTSVNGQTGAVTIQGVPTGTLLMWGTSTAPTGYVLCNGSAISRTTYAALFAVISTTFGAGDGSTTFNVPNYTNRVPYGTTLAAVGGSADAIVVAHSHGVNDPGHNHTLNDPGHSHGVADPGHAHGYTVANQTTTVSNGFADISVLSGTGGAATAGSGTGIGIYGATTGTYNSASGTGVSVQSAGGSGTGANLPPYLGINFIIKT